MIAELVGGRMEVKDGNPWLFIKTDQLVDGAQGELAGPVLPHVSEAPFRPDGEFEAADAYDVEVRLWQVGGAQADSESAVDAVFRVLTPTGFAAIQVRDDDKLVRATLGAGSRDFAAGTTIYDWDSDEWSGFVVDGPTDQDLR